MLVKDSADVQLTMSATRLKAYIACCCQPRHTVQSLYMLMIILAFQRQCDTQC